MSKGVDHVHKRDDSERFHKTPQPFEFAKKTIPRSTEPEDPKFKKLSLPKPS